MHVLALPLIAAQGMPRRKCLFHADLKHSIGQTFLPAFPVLFVSFLRFWFLASSRETGKRPPSSKPSCTSAATLKKSYHTPSAESCYPVTPALRDPFSFESIAQTLASTPKPPA